MNTVILKGTTIGDNSIIGASSLVSGEIPGNVIAGGNPAPGAIRPLSQPDAGALAPPQPDQQIA